MNSFKFQTPKGENGAQTTYTFPKLENKLENTPRRMEMHFSFEIGLYEYRPKKYKNAFHVLMLFLNVHVWEERCVITFSRPE